MTRVQQTISPIDGLVIVERELAADVQINKALATAKTVQRKWAQTPIQARIELCRRFADKMLERKEELGREITLQMGRPIRYTPNEIQGLWDRATWMADIAETTLADIKLPAKAGFNRFIRRVPIGVVFAIVPWNYPYLTAVNSVIPALIAGNSVLLKHSPQTPLCAERIAEAFAEVGLPQGVFQFLHLSDKDADRIVRSPEIDFVAFTGSVAVGKIVQKAASDHFIGVGLELGGKDPAYVRSDAILEHAIENLVDGAFFNSGQSCCAVERIYVHQDVYRSFVEGAIALTQRYVLANPLEPQTTLGPMVRTSSADFVRHQILEARAQGAQLLIEESSFPTSHVGTPYLAPQILVNVNHSMAAMQDESFGPVVGIMPVKSDEEAIQLMNDSRFGLTASVWTRDEDAAVRIGDQVETGTWLMNRCDVLDPALAWTGVKDSGRGCTLSQVGYEHLTRPKSYHLKQ